MSEQSSPPPACLLYIGYEYEYCVFGIVGGNTLHKDFSEHSRGINEDRGHSQAPHPIMKASIFSGQHTVACIVHVADKARLCTTPVTALGLHVLVSNDSSIVNRLTCFIVSLLWEPNIWTSCY